MFCSVLAHGVSSNVPSESHLYEKLEKLQAFGLIDTYVSGIKPLSRMEFARQIKEAIKNRSDKNGSEYSLIDKILKNLQTEFAQELEDGNNKIKNRFPNKISLETVYLKQDSTAHLETNAFNKPLVSNRSGQNLSGGINTVSNMNGWIDFYEYASIYLEPRIITRQQDKNFDIDIPVGYMKFGFKNFEVLMGRDDIMYGFGYSGKMQMSNNPKPLTMIKISNPYPAHLPWILKHLGAFKFEFLFSMLENERDHANPTFWAMALYFKPLKWFEWGLARTTVLGGKGVPSLSFWEYFLEASMGFRIYDFTNVNPGNNTVSAYFLFTLPFLRNTQVFFDGYFEDFGPANIKRKQAFTRDFAFNTGIAIPRITKDGRFSFQTEFVKTTEITYRNTVYSDGYTRTGEIIGHHLGPDAFANYNRFTFTYSKDLLFKIDFNYEKHGRLGKDQFSLALSPDIFEKPENRWAFILGADLQLNDHIGFKLRAGYERIENYNFIASSSKNNAIAALGVSYKL